jgi:predicted DNA-binding antitoxin AbrB/MazE fold protein
VSQTITAVYENGVLRPLTPLTLPEHAQVELEVRLATEPAEALAQRERVRHALATAGVLASSDQPPNEQEPLSAQERAALAQALAEAGVPPCPPSSWMSARVGDG